jgi:hypothetical protein
MAGLEKDQNPTPRTIDARIVELQARLKVLQPALRELMGKALHLFDDVFPQAPHPLDTVEPRSVYATNTLNVCPVEQIPMCRELTIMIGANTWVQVIRNTESLGSLTPSERVLFWRPEGENRRQIDVTRTQSPVRKDYPYTIETADYSTRGGFLSFVGDGPYVGQEPFIEEANQAIDVARKVADEYGFFVPVL